MSNTIKLKRSNSAGAIPSSLSPGELAVNTADRRLTVGNNSSVVVCPAAGVMTGTDYPLNPLTGQVFFNTTSARLYIYNGSSWIEVTAGSRKNLLINGCLRVWQRGTSTSASGWGAPDRWGHLGTTSTWTVSRQAFTAGQTDVPGEPRYYLRDVVTTGSAAGAYHLLRQSIEDVRTAAGQTVTLSFWAKADAAKNIAVELFQYTGTSGSGGGTLGGQKVALTTSWARYSVTFDVPSLSGATIDDTTGDHALYVWIWMDAGSNFNSRTGTLGNQSGTFEFANIQLEIGSEATDFEYRPIGEEVQLCKRYYQKSYSIDTVPGTSGTSTGAAALAVGYIGATSMWGASWGLHVQMRGIPTVKTYLINNGTVNKVGLYDATGASVHDSTVFYVSHDGASVSVATGLSGKTSGQAATLYFQWTADAEL